MDFYKGTIPIFDDATSSDHFFPVGVGRGYTERDYANHPEPMFAQPDTMQLIPESEWDARYDEQEATKSSLEHLFLGADGQSPAFVNLDQNGQGFCWAYSTAQAIMLTRLRMGLPTVRLSAHAVACKIKGFRDEGGWCGLSAEFARENGYPSVDAWPEQSMSRQYDNPSTWADAARHKITSDWVDLRKQVYDRNLTEAQSATCSFLDMPGPEDFNWWGHSVCRLRHVRIERGSWGKLILNSWLNWGRFGLGVLRGSKMPCNGAIALQSVTAN